MRLRSLLMSALPLVGLCLVGCEAGVPADAPKTPEAGTSDYDAYNNAGRSGPPGASGAHGGGAGGGHGGK